MAVSRHAAPSRMTLFYFLHDVLLAERQVSSTQRHGPEPCWRLAITRVLHLTERYQVYQGWQQYQAKSVERPHLPGLPPSTSAAAQEVVQLELHQPVHQAGGQRQ